MPRAIEVGVPIHHEAEGILRGEGMVAHIGVEVGAIGIGGEEAASRDLGTFLSDHIFCMSYLFASSDSKFRSSWKPTPIVSPVSSGGIILTIKRLLGYR